jgi:hypothetical protein
LHERRGFEHDTAGSTRGALARAEHRPEPARYDDVVRLQRGAGNAATAALIAQHGKGPLGDKPVYGLLVDRKTKAPKAPKPPAVTSQSVTVTPISAAVSTRPGGFSWPVWFSIGAAAGNDGWVIQEIKVTEKYKQQNGTKVTDDKHYWEAWQLKQGKTTTIYQDEGLDTNDDLYYNPPKPAGSKGSVVAKGKARFFEGPLPAGYIQNNPATYAGILYSSTTAPPYWSGSMADHNLTVTWDDTPPSKLRKLGARVGVAAAVAPDKITTTP